MNIKSIAKSTGGVLKQEVVYAWGESKWLPLATAIAVLSGKIGPIPTIPYIHFPLILLCLLLNLGRHWTIEKVSVCFLFYLPLNIIIASPDPVFQSWPRLGTFVFVFLLASPLFKGEYLQSIRRGILIAILLTSSFISIGSFFCYFLGINYMTNQATGEAISSFEGSGGGFGGLTIQSIALGMYSGMAIIYMFYRLQKQKKEKRIIYYVMMGIMFLTMLFAASRSALMATAGGFLIMLYHKQRANGNYIKTLLAIVIGAMLTFPLWEGAAAGVVNKQKANNKIEGKYGSRSEKWEARMEEFAGSPVFGVGFSAIDPNGRDTFIKKTGTIEPGSSWLAILSMTGIVGMFLYLIMVGLPMGFLHKKPSSYNTLLQGLLTFLLIHTITEGYLFAGGNATCFQAWLIIGCAYDKMQSDDEEETDDVEGDESENADDIDNQYS